MALKSTISPFPVLRRWDRSAAILQFGNVERAQTGRRVLLRGLGTFSNPSKDLLPVLQECGYATLPDDVRTIVSTQNPNKKAPVWPQVAEFVRDSVTVAAPHTSYTANLLMTVASKYVMWCVQDQGWPLDGEVLWSVHAIDLYATDDGQGHSDGTRRNSRAMLMRISEVLVPSEHGEKPTALNRKSTAAPYSVVEISTYRKWARTQVSNQNRDRAMLMLVLCAGAGLPSKEVHLIRPEDVVNDDAGIVINVPGDNPRAVPLLAQWEEWMRALLDRLPAGEPLWGPITRKDTHNLLSNFTERTVGPRPNGQRLRATWLVTHLRAAVPMKDLLRAAGVRKFEHLPLLLDYIPQSSDTNYRGALRGEVGA
ncbi:hypothetical protein [Glutamicibacter protophormiae]|uniref:hypothetical protein n=1 Tax=Glutamicibacter protophormiae TaxID=37930 RepID=UPI003A90C414